MSTVGLSGTGLLRATTTGCRAVGFTVAASPMRVSLAATQSAQDRRSPACAVLVEMLGKRRTVSRSSSGWFMPRDAGGNRTMQGEEALGRVNVGAREQHPDRHSRGLDGLF